MYFPLSCISLRPAVVAILFFHSTQAFLALMSCYVLGGKDDPLVAYFWPASWQMRHQTDIHVPTHSCLSSEIDDMQKHIRTVFCTGPNGNRQVYFFFSTTIFAPWAWPKEYRRHVLAHHHTHFFSRPPWFGFTQTLSAKFLFFLTQPLPARSLTHPLTHSLTHSLTDPLAYSLAPHICRYLQKKTNRQQKEQTVHYRFQICVSIVYTL